jgi:predicted O-methyltransferase YrrM
MRPDRALRRAEAIEGWLERCEAELLLGAAIQAARSEGVHDFVEVGSFCGKATTLLASVLQALSTDGRVYAIDPHDGRVGAEGDTLEAGPTLDRFQRNLALAGVLEQVEIWRCKSHDIEWSRPISLLLIDGLHDYENVRLDFERFAPHLAQHGLVVFHDYAAYYPGVVRFVDELLRTRYELVQRAGTLVVLRPTRGHVLARIGVQQPTALDAQLDARLGTQPLAVSAE